MIIGEGLQYLATLFPHPLYVVGGAVRDFLMGYTPTDYDICCQMPPEEVIALLENCNDIKVSTTSPKLGTLKISCCGEHYEYTTFRTDSYALDGSHEPQSVAFTNSILEDSLRRDFTVNAIYFDIKNNKIVDPLGCIADVKNHVIRTTRPPQQVFEEDALRLLRAIRIAAETNCRITTYTLQAISQNAFRLQKIAVERIADECNKILVADTKNNLTATHTTAINTLVECGLMQYIFPELLDCIGAKQRTDIHLYDVYNHVLRTTNEAPPSIRLIALLHDIAKPVIRKMDGYRLNHAKLGAEMVRTMLARLRYSTATIERTASVIEHHMFNMYLCEEKEVQHKFVQEHWDIIDDIIALKHADYLGTGTFKDLCPSGKKLQQIKDDMIAHNVPLKVIDLKVNGNDLIALNIPPIERGTILTKLLRETSYNYNLHTREAQLALLKLI